MKLWIITVNLSPDKAAVEKCQARSHQHDQAGADQHERRIANVYRHGV
jgi:hypothetical protein